MPKQTTDNDFPKTRRIGDIIPLEKARPPIHNAAEFANIEVTLVNFEFKSGSEQYAKNGIVGNYVIMECLHPDTDETVFISCGGYVVLKQLEAVNKVEDLPLPVIFVKDTDGKTWILK